MPDLTPPRAGRAFIELMQQIDPAGLARAKTRLAVWGAVLEAVPELGEALKAAHRPWTSSDPEIVAAWTECMETAKLADEKGKQELAASYFTPPETIEDWERLARIVEIPHDIIQSGNYTLYDVHEAAVAWAERQRIKAKLAHQSTGEKAAATSSKISLALAVLNDHPDWTNKQVAEKVGCNEKYLSQNPTYRAAKEAIAGLGGGKSAARKAVAGAGDGRIRGLGPNFLPNLEISQRSASELENTGIPVVNSTVV